MIQKTITYVDFNDETQTETFNFHITKTKLTDHMVQLKPKFEEMQSRLSGDKRELNLDEVYMILDLIKTMIELSYGVRSEDGKRFRQTAEVYQEFRDSAAYDAMLTGFMEDPASGMEFMQAVMPKDLMDQAQEMLPFTDGAEPAAVGTDVTFPEVVTNDPLKGLSPEEVAAAVAQLRSTNA